MKIRNVQIEFVVDRLSKITADAYVLPYFSRHVNPDHERWEVENAGARGVRRFIELRMNRHLQDNPLSLGDVIITHSGGGKSKFLINMICRSHNAETICWGIHGGLIGMFMEAPLFGLQTVAMAPLCVCDGLTEFAFARELRKAIESYTGSICITNIIVACKTKEQAEELQKALAQE